MDNYEDDFDFGDFSFDEDEDDFKNAEWFITPQKQRKKHVEYSNAERLAEDVNVFSEGDRMYCLLAGSFIFGDLIEALFTTHSWYAETLTISTLSMSEENIESLRNLIDGGYIGAINLIISDYFFSHERHKNGLVPFLYDRLGDNDFNFQLTTCGTHTKICAFRTQHDENIVIHGSANLRSSGSIEQIMIENNKELFEYNEAVLNKITEHGKTIDTSMRGKRLWQVVEVAAEAEEQKAVQKQAQEAAKR